MSNSKILNLGCGEKPMPDAVNIDIYKGKEVDLVCDIKKGLPFGKEEIEEVRAEYFLQQILDNREFVFVMNDIWRVLKPNGLFKFTVPNARYSTAFKDPFDCRYFTKETFDYFDCGHRRYKYYKGYGFKPWKVLNIEEFAGPNDPQKDRFYVVLRKL